MFKNAGNAAYGRVNLQACAHAFERRRTSTRPATTSGRPWNNGDKERGLGIQKTARRARIRCQRPGSSSTKRTAASPIPSGSRRSRTRTTRPRTRSRRTASGIRPTTSSPQSVRATSLSRRCSSPNAYAAFANGGTLWTPHVERVGERTRSTKQVSDVTPQAIRQVSIPATVRAAMTAGLRGRDSPTRRAPRTRAFQGFPLEPFRSSGKTGTAQVARGGRDTSCVRRATSRPTHRSTSWSRSSKRAGTARRPRRRSCGRSSKRSTASRRHADPVARHGQRLMATITALTRLAARTATRSSRFAHLDLALLGAADSSISGARPADDLLVDPDAPRAAGRDPLYLRRTPGARDRARRHRDGDHDGDRLPAASATRGRSCTSPCCRCSSACSLLGRSHKGAQAWFQVGPLQFQPSEIAKIAVIVAVAGLLPPTPRRSRRVAPRRRDRCWSRLCRWRSCSCSTTSAPCS